MMVTETQLLDAQSTYDKKKKEKSLVLQAKFWKDFVNWVNIPLSEKGRISVWKQYSVLVMKHFLIWKKEGKLSLTEPWDKFYHHWNCGLNGRWQNFLKYTDTYHRNPKSSIYLLEVLYLGKQHEY